MTLVNPKVFQLTIIAKALRLYAQTGIKANRAYTPGNMRKTTEALLGRKFAARDYLGMASALETKRDELMGIYQIKTKYYSGPAKLVWGNYAYDDSPALQLVHPDTGEPLATASVVLEYDPAPEGHVWIKTWSENEGLWEELLRIEVLADTGLSSPISHWGSVAKLGKILP